MITIRESDERGHADFGWLDSRHTFSFGEYYDPKHMGYRSLRVINDDLIDGGQGFGMHPHRDMEIISYVVEGSLEHRDSMGNGSVIVPGDVQMMSAGTGVKHSEFNPDPDKRMRLLQIWIMPDRVGHTPRYGQKKFTTEEKKNRLKLVASNDGRDGSIPIHQDALLYATIADKGTKLVHRITAGRGAWLQVISGELDLNGQKLVHGDGAHTDDETTLTITAAKDAEFLLFDLA